MARAAVDKTNLSGGEISPWLAANARRAQHQNGLARQRNFVTMAEGAVTRRPGTRFIAALKNEAQLAALLKFRYAAADSYTLVLNGGAIRFLRAGGVLLDGATPKEVPIPYAAGDLANVRIAQEGNVAWLVCRGFEPRTLTRGAAHTDWTLALYRPTGGPVKTQNLDPLKTVTASATTGAGVALTGAGTSFAAGHVGSVWRLDESDLSLIPNWKAEETITLPTEVVPSGGAVNIGNFTNPANAFDGNVATAATRAAASGFIGRTPAAASAIYTARARGSFTAAGQDTALTLSLYGKTGAAPATLTDGTLLATVALGTSSTFDVTLVSSNFVAAFAHVWLALAGGAGVTALSVTELDLARFTTGATPLLRRYDGNVYEAIAGANAGLAPPTHSEGDVLSEQGGVFWRFRHGPYGMVRIVAVADATHATADVLKRLPDSVTQRPTYRWHEGAWNGIDGWPERVLLIDRGLFFARGRDWWMTTTANPDDFEQTVLDDSALASRVRCPDGALPAIEWAMDNGVIVLGCRDGEVLIRAAGVFDPLTAATVRQPPASSEGSAPHIPAAVEDGAIWIGATRKELFFAAFNAETQKLSPKPVSIVGRHLLKPKAAGLAWQKNPHRVCWGYCQDGSLFGLTFNSAHEIVAMHGHPLTNGAIENVLALPASDEGVSEVYFVVRRTIGGATRRYLEQLGPYFETADDAQTEAHAAWFFDSALEYSGAATASISGLSHLALQEVGIFADNAAHARKTVSAAGVVTLDRDTTHAVVGLPIDAYVTDLPRNIVTPAGSSKGKIKRATHATVDLVESVGGTLECDGGLPEDMQLTGGLDYGIAPRLVTGPVRVSLGAPLADEVVLTLRASEGFPMTVTGLSPELDVVEG